MSVKKYPIVPSRLRVRLSVTLLAGAALGFFPDSTALVKDGHADARATFIIGAAKIDITPPAAGSGAEPAQFAACDPKYNGARQFAFQEPYIDSKGLSQYAPGDAYCDANGNGRYDGIYLGGGSGRNRVPKSVLDEISAQAMVFGDAAGHHKVAVLSVDSVGLQYPAVQEMIAAAKAAAPSLQDVLVASTHDESAPDPVGLWGPEETASGVNDYYLEFLAKQAAAVASSANAAARPAHLRFVETHEPASFRPCFSSYPFVHDPKIIAMQAVEARNPSHVIFTLASYGIHAEGYGFSKDPALRLGMSADWPGQMRDDLEASYGGVAVALAGLIGSVETPTVFPGATVSSVPVAPLSDAACDGYTIFPAPTGVSPLPSGTVAKTQAIGHAMADAVKQAFSHHDWEWSVSGDVRSKVSEFCLPIENNFFLQAASFGIIKRSTGCGGDMQQTASAVAVADIGDGQLVFAPGEIFPLTFYRGFLGQNDMPFPDQPMTPFVGAQLTGRYNFFAGLGMDLLGYLMPPANFVGEPGEVDQEPWKSYTKVHTDEKDRFGYEHGDDQESLGPHAGLTVANEILATLKVTDPRGPRDTRTLTGRFIDKNGRIARSPFPSATFDGAVGVWVLRPGETDFKKGAGKIYAEAGHLLIGGRLANGVLGGFVDLHGRPESHGFSYATRGVWLLGLDDEGHTGRVFVDVYPGN